LFLDSIGPGATPFKQNLRQNNITGAELDAVTSPKDIVKLGVNIMAKARMIFERIQKVKQSGGVVDF